ncbi:HTH-type transcriptional regulator/antitoxin HipB [Oxalobacteraceae bacterium GrIS 2.11]
MDYPIKTLSQLRPILQGCRKKANLTQTDVAELLGITQQSYAQIEANPASTSVERLYKIMRLLNVELVLNYLSSEPTAVNTRPTQQSAAKKSAKQAAKPAATRAPAKTNQAPQKITPPSGKKVAW